MYKMILGLKNGNKIFGIIIMVITLWIMPKTLFAQTINSDSLSVVIPDSLKADTSIIQKIPPLKDLIDSAIALSPLIQRQSKQIVIRQLNTRTVNQEWLKYINLFGTANYGVYDNFMSVQDQSVVGSTINTGNSFRWSVGVAVAGAPFYDMLNKPTQHKIKELEMQQEIDSKKDLELQIKDAVIQQYNMTLMSYQVMIISNKNVQSNFTQLVMSEQMFNQGEASIYALANVREMYFKSLINYQKNLYEFRTNYMILESICGFKFTSP